MSKEDFPRTEYPDTFANGSMAPLVVLPFPKQLKNMPPPPYIPVVL